MKILKFNNQDFKADKIIKTKTDIIGYSDGIEVFAFRGISDFSGFVLEEGQTFDIVQPTQQELVNAQLLKSNANTQLQLKNQLLVNSELLKQVAELKNGGVK